MCWIDSGAGVGRSPLLRRASAELSDVCPVCRLDRAGTREHRDRQFPPPNGLFARVCLHVRQANRGFCRDTDAGLRAAKLLGIDRRSVVNSFHWPDVELCNGALSAASECCAAARAVFLLWLDVGLQHHGLRSGSAAALSDWALGRIRRAGQLHDCFRVRPPAVDRAECAHQPGRVSRAGALDEGP